MNNKKTTTKLKVLDSKKVINSINKQLAPILEDKFGIILTHGEFITDFTSINYYSIFDCFILFKKNTMNFLHNFSLQSLEGSEFVQSKENLYFKMPVFLKAFDNLNDKVIIYLCYFNIFVYEDKTVKVEYGNDLINPPVSGDLMDLKNHHYMKNLKTSKDRKSYTVLKNSFDLFR